MAPTEGTSRSANNLLQYMHRVLLAGGFALLGAFGGAGWVYVVTVIFVGDLFKIHNEKLLNTLFSLHAVGGMAGFILGFILSLLIFKAEQKGVTEDEITKKYVGTFGCRMIFAGVPTFFGFLEALVVCLKDLPFEARLGTTVATWLALAILVAIYVMSMALYGRLPKRLIIPIGLTSWILTFLIVCWFFWFEPGAF